MRRSGSVMEREVPACEDGGGEVRCECVDVEAVLPEV